MTDSRSVWDQDYISRGCLWGGNPALLPDVVAGASVLELGSGSGKTLHALMNRSCDITAIDFSKKAAEMSYRIITKYHAGDALVADARGLPFVNDAFGVVVASHVIGHMQYDDRVTIVSEAARVLQPDGRLFFVEFSVDDMRNGTGREVEDATFQRGKGIITHYFTEPEVEALFSMLRKESVFSRHWKMRVRGRDLLRAEIGGIFSKSY
jgi:ubiquinone/menaquinone biosynthesis C-methylase UbiE